MKKKLSEILPGERFYLREGQSALRLMIGKCDGGIAVQDDKTGDLYKWPDRDCDLQEEFVMYSPPPAPRYRPFASAKEFEPHRDRWVDTGVEITRVTMYTGSGFWHDGCSIRMNWDDAFVQCKFDDGSPFGVLND